MIVGFDQISVYTGISVYLRFVCIWITHFQETGNKMENCPNGIRIVWVNGYFVTFYL